MMPTSPTGNSFYAVDWGTSSFRLHLLSGDGGIISATKSDKGAGRMAGVGFEDYLIDQISTLSGGLDHPRVLMCGMVGSTIGWLNAGYIPCPASPFDVAGKLVRAPTDRLDVEIVPGLRCRSPLGEPDVMRGEETQILGWLTTTNQQPERDALLCLPGTHTKWAKVTDGRVESFSTTYTGELFALLCERSVLVVGDQKPDEAAFYDGVQRGLRSPALSQTLFTARSRVLVGELPASSAKSYLSGLVIGSDVGSAIELWNPSSGITIIGEQGISRLYRDALRLLSIETRICNGEEMAVRGLHAINGLKVSRF